MQKYQAADVLWFTQRFAVVGSVMWRLCVVWRSGPGISTNVVEMKHEVVESC